MSRNSQHKQRRLRQRERADERERQRAEDRQKPTVPHPAGHLRWANLSFRGNRVMGFVPVPGLPVFTATTPEELSAALGAIAVTDGEA